MLAVLVFGAWTGTRLAQPFNARGDAVFHASFVRSMQLTGWYSAGPFLGAPNGQDMVDFPLGGDHLHLVLLRLLAELPISAFTAVNLFVLMSFGVIGGVTHLVLRSLGSDALPAAGAALLYAFVPYHFSRTTVHPFLSFYVAVPLAVLLAVWVADGRLSVRNARWRWATAIACVVVVGSADAYYAVFGAICMVTAAAVGALRARSLRPLVVGVATAAVVGLVLVTNVMPSLLHRRADGDNIEVAHRTPVDSEIYGLRPASLVVPEPTHRIAKLAARGVDLNAVPTPGEQGLYLGFVGGLGALVLLGACLGGLAGVKVPTVLGLFAAMAVAMLLVGARGGGGFLLSLVGFTEIRSWDRTSVVIALLGLGAMAIGATGASRRIGPRLVALATAVLVVLGLLDQIPLHPVPDRATTVAQVNSERMLVHEMEQALPPGSMVYQLPYLRFPEGGGGQLRSLDYDLLRPYVLGSGSLRWSYGGLRGRSADWQEVWAAQPIPVLLRAVAAAGFSALLVDRYAYENGAADLLDQLTALTGERPRPSDDARLAWIDLRGFAASTRAGLGPAAEDLGRAVTSIPRAVWASGFRFLTGDPPGERLVADGAVLELRAAAGRRQAADLLLTINVPNGVIVAVETAGGSWRSSGSGLQYGRLPMLLGDRPTDVRFNITGAASLTFGRLWAVDDAALRLLPEPSTSAAVP